MLTLLGHRTRPFCDGLSRRSFLQVGSLGLGGLSLPALLRADSQPGTRSTGRSVVMIYLPGGPTQHETFDPKPDAPQEIRGSFGPISTSVPSATFCELLPRLAQTAKHFSVVRTLTGMKNRHECFQCYSGRPGGRNEDNEPAGGWPSFGSVVSRVLGSGEPGIPAFVDASPKMGYGPYNQRGQHDASPRVSWPGFTGQQHTPFGLESDVKSDLVLQGLDLSRFQNRRDLLASLAQFQKRVNVDGLDSFHQEAFGILTSNRLAEALDLESEPIQVRERYGRAQPTNPAYGGAPQSPQHLLLARRLVEAGVRCVTVAFGAWDWHANGPDTIEGLAKLYLPVFDHALAVFFEDLHERGLLENVSVVVWGEFGRTPRINVDGGRDHWPDTQSILLAGGGVQGGRIIGQTDSSGGTPAQRPVHVQEVFATLYRNLGIDANAVTIPDLSGRPHYLVEENRQPIGELF
ncbi:MAG: DUF1501 domain-containing protein [Pirellulales bacterium]